jgi:hypothetical protein
MPVFAGVVLAILDNAADLRTPLYLIRLIFLEIGRLGIGANDYTLHPLQRIPIGFQGTSPSVTP